MHYNKTPINRQLNWVLKTKEKKEQLGGKWSAATCDLSAIKIAGTPRGAWQVTQWVAKQIQLPLTRMLPKQGPRWEWYDIGMAW